MEKFASWNEPWKAAWRRPRRRMATWGELEKDSGLGLLGIKEKLTALEAEHALCGGDRRRQLARIEELEAGNAGMTAEKQELADQVGPLLLPILASRDASPASTPTR